MAEPVCRLRGIVRGYRQGERAIEVLQGVDLTLAHGETVALVGPSGAGKSTLLHIVGLLEPPDAGQVTIDGQDSARLSDGVRTRLRRAKIGFVYQFHHLLPEFTATENVALPQMIAGVGADQADARARKLLESLGLEQRLRHRPSQLSGGEQQRCAIARAIANEPLLLLADEPTGNLDEATGERVFNALTESVRASGTAALIATHNPALAARMDRTYRLAGGRLVEGP